MHARGAHEINARARESERRQFLMLAAVPPPRPRKVSARGQQLRQFLARALHELAARVEPSHLVKPSSRGAEDSPLIAV
jgi:hypothetical protein